MRKTLVAVGVLMVATIVLSCCGFLKSPKTPAVVLLNAWMNQDYKEAFACLAPELQEVKSFEAFRDEVDKIRIKEYSISSINVHDKDSAEAKASIILEDSAKTGFVIRLIRQGEYWVVSGYEIGANLPIED